MTLSLSATRHANLGQSCGRYNSAVNSNYHNAGASAIHSISAALEAVYMGSCRSAVSAQSGSEKKRKNGMLDQVLIADPVARLLVNI
eukprot:scaffold23658_cov19-Prasinocladus_malaysianus.AAC.3